VEAEVEALIIFQVEVDLAYQEEVVYQLHLQQEHYYQEWVEDLLHQQQ
jgi:hypothetical protein